MDCEKCGNRSYREWCPYCDTETPMTGEIDTFRSRIAALEAENAGLKAQISTLVERKTPATKQMANLANAMWEDAESEVKELTARRAVGDGGGG